jgi:hypothetical protein
MFSTFAETPKTYSSYQYERILYNDLAEKFPPELYHITELLECTQMDRLKIQEN